MNHNDDQFVHALRRMAAAAPQDAPPELGLKLRDAFRTHRRQRRRARLLTISSVAAGLIGVAAWTWFATFASRSQQPERNMPQLVQHIPAPAPVRVPPTAPAPSVAEKPAAVARRLKTAPPPKTNARLETPPDATHDASVAMGDFMALPSFDPAMPFERSQIVRVELPGQALNLFGIPVSSEMFDRRVVADLAVAQDGRPYAVRFVQGYK